MTFYFSLQFNRFRRKLMEFGLHPMAGIVLIATGFVVLSAFLFSRTEQAAWVYAAGAALAISTLGEQRRNDILLAVFSRSDYQRVRLIENAMAVLPFVLFLLWKREFPIAAGMVLTAPLLALLRFRIRFGSVVPTPFARFPYEFPTGFRQTLLPLAGIVSLLFQAVRVGNFNLGVFALGLVFLLSMSYYLQPEPVYFVWIYRSDSVGFLFQKWRTALICSTQLALPAALVLALFFPENLWWIAGVLVLGYLLLGTIIVAKYSAFPGEMGFPQFILFGLALWFPPLLLLVIPVFYVQAKKKLKVILE